MFQVSLLREQLSKEARSRRSYILSSQTINADVSELRQQLGDSLDMVHNASRAHLQSGLLDRYKLQVLLLDNYLKFFKRCAYSLADVNLNLQGS